MSPIQSSDTWSQLIIQCTSSWKPKTSEESLWTAPLSLIMRPPHLRKVVGTQTKERVVPGDLSLAPYCPSINGRLVVPCMHFRNKLIVIPEIREELQAPAQDGGFQSLDSSSHISTCCRPTPALSMGVAHSKAWPRCCHLMDPRDAY